MLALAAMAFAIPLHFEPNNSSLNSRIRFSAVTNRYTLELSDTAIAVHFRGGSLGNGTVRLNIPRTRPEGAEELAAKSNYYLSSRSV